ncbi:MAG: ATPase [Lachnospiraceae bacterium]|jgi:sugar (pentulose or hexulose) kinase|nr:ATPase [Lachnospiraceae bacterium]
MKKNIESIKVIIREAKTSLGIELGSTRIKAVLIDLEGNLLATGNHSWENRLEDGYWTYHLDDIINGIQECYEDLISSIEKEYEIIPEKYGAIGISAMMHGYLAFDENDELLTPFRTWRNTTTKEASEILSDLFDFQIPQRWSVAHLYQAILNKEEHINKIAHITTLAGFVHYLLTGKKVLGIGDASGMFPIGTTNDYDNNLLDIFDDNAAKFGLQWKIREILPEVINAGDDAGYLSEEGAKILDMSGTLKAGIPLCPPEGDAGTGMIATNSITERTGNISAGTSIFLMAVLEKALSKRYPQLDIVSTPDGKPVAMVHCNNCTADIDAWLKVFVQLLQAFCCVVDTHTLYFTLFQKALYANTDAGGLLSYNFLSGEHLVDLEEGRPLFVRMPDAEFTLENFMRSLLYSSFACLRIGLEILEAENVKLDRLLGHGGLFKSSKVAAGFIASALNCPVSVMESAGEGGAWGIALLAAYRIAHERDSRLPLSNWLDAEIFANLKTRTENPDSYDAKGFEKYFDLYKKGLNIEKTAIKCIS